MKARLSLLMGAALLCGASSGLRAEEAGPLSSLFGSGWGLGWGGEVFLEGRRTEHADWIEPLAGARDQRGGYGGRLHASKVWTNGLSFSGEASFRRMEGEDPDLRLRRLRFAHQGSLTLEIGYDLLGWSFFEQIHPLDPVERQAFRLDPDDLSQDSASPYAQIAYADSGGGFTRGLVASRAQKPRDFAGDELVFGLRHERFFGEAQAAGQVLFGPEEALRIGAGLNMAHGPNVWSLEIEQVEGGAGPLGGEASGLRVLAGMRRALGSGSQIEVGYHHNGLGFDGAEWSALTADLDAARAGLALGDFSGAGLMSDVAEASRARFLRRDHLFASYSSADRFGPLAFTLGAYYGLADQSALGFLDLDYDLTEALSLRLNAAVGLGAKDGEFGLRPASVGLWLVHAFGAPPS